MFDATTIGKWVMIGGAGLFVLGLIIWVVGRVGVPFGNLPGDIKIESGSFTFYFPLVSSIIISIVLTILLNIFLRFLNRP